jgi:indolepyruvate ferredoxin oxidoreductase beta subunit
VSQTNIFLCGVGGQGIGMLAEVLIQACLRAGHKVKGMDTHGLAQRGGVVVSHLRLGEGVRSPEIPPGQADIVLGLERLEALRGALSMLKPGGSVVYYDCEYQPMHVRMGKAKYPSAAELEAAVAARGGGVERVLVEGLKDPRMQNTALLGRLAGLGLIQGLTPELVEETLREVIPASALDDNLAVFRQAAQPVNAAHGG